MLPRIWNNFWGRNLADQGSADILILFGLQEVLIDTWSTFSTGDTWKRRYLHYIPENCRLSTIWRPPGPIRDEIENQNQAMLRKVVSSMSSPLMDLIRHRGKQTRQWRVFENGHASGWLWCDWCSVHLILNAHFRRLKFVSFLGHPTFAFLWGEKITHLDAEHPRSLAQRKLIRFHLTTNYQTLFDWNCHT